MIVPTILYTIYRTINPLKDKNAGIVLYAIIGFPLTMFVSVIFAAFDTLAFGYVVHFILVGFIEETAKFVAFATVDDKFKSDKLVEIGLSFALYENFWYEVAFPGHSPLLMVQYRVLPNIMHFVLAIIGIALFRNMNPKKTTDYAKIIAILAILHALFDLGIIFGIAPVIFT